MIYTGTYVPIRIFNGYMRWKKDKAPAYMAQNVEQGKGKYEYV